MLQPKKMPREDEGVAEDFPADEELFAEEATNEEANAEEAFTEDAAAEAETSEERVLGEMTNATPEEQEQYNMFVSQAYNLIYDDAMMPQIIEMLKGEGDPIEGLARAASMIISRVRASAIEAGMELSGDVLLHAGTEVLEDLAELSKEAEVKDYTQDPDALEGAYFRALDIFRMELQENGELDPQANQADLELLAQMDEAGELETVFSNLANEDTKAAEDSGAAEPPVEEEEV